MRISARSLFLFIAFPLIQATSALAANTITLRLRSAGNANELVSFLSTDKYFVVQLKVRSVRKTSALSDKLLASWISVELPEENISCLLNKLIARNSIDIAETSNKLIFGKSENESIRIPNHFQVKKRTSVKIALIDDGFLLNHKNLKNYWSINKNEIPGNYKDDDGNGYTDDVCGWDVADNDNDVTFPKERAKVFYHGTYLADVIGRFNNWKDPSDRLSLNCPIEIIPVKCLSDNSTYSYLKDSYKGIEYAIKAGADIINCSWGGGQISKYERDLISAANKMGILVIASAGNWGSEKEQFPASIKEVIAVAGIDSSGKKIGLSCYGPFVDLSSVGKDIHGASIWSETKDTLVTGTSTSVAMVSGMAGVLLSCFPKLTTRDLYYYLQAGAIPIDSLNTGYAGKLGAGRADILNTANLIQGTSDQHSVKNPEGYLVIKNTGKNQVKEFLIRPNGRYKGMHIYKPSVISGSMEGIKIRMSDPSGLVAKEFDAFNFPDSVYFSADSLNIQVSGKGKKEIYLPYQMVTVDSSRLYCSSVQEIDLKEGVIEDGSGNNNYAGGQDCKWLIKANPGSRISIKFTELNTEPNVDKVYIFNGEGTHEYILAILSGSNLPPEITSTGNKMLVWFVTDNKNHGKGWKAEFRTFEGE